MHKRFFKARESEGTTIAFSNRRVVIADQLKGWYKDVNKVEVLSYCACIIFENWCIFERVTQFESGDMLI